MKEYQLKALLQVVESGSIRAAARALDLSQPAVTKAIRELEAEVGAPLINRSFRGVALTEFGRELSTRARLAHMQLAMAREEIQQLLGGKQASVSIAVTPIVFMGALPLVLRDFKREMPYAQVKLYEGLMPWATTQLREGFVHFAVAGARQRALDADLEFEPISELEMMVACRPGHPLAHATHWEELVDAEWLVVRAPDSVHTVLFDHLESLGLPLPERTVEANTFGVSWGLLTRSDTLLVLPARFLSIEPYAQQIVRVPLSLDLPTMTLGILKLRGSPMSHAAAKLATLFQRHCR
jgi:LysR family transcriptional regulator of abg operon